MKHTIPALKAPRSETAIRFARYRRQMRLGAAAMLSLSTLRALSAVEQRQADRLTRSIVAAGRTDDSTTDGEALTPERSEVAALAARSAVLTHGERAALHAARPGSRSVIWRKPAVVTDDENDQPLPPGYIAAPGAPYESAFLNANDPEVRAIEAAAAIEAGLEITARETFDAHCLAAAAFVSDYAAPAPVDYVPFAPEITAPIAAPVVPAPVALAPAPRDPIADHAALLAAVMRKAARRA